MLKQCPECELQVSDKALTCPHCGYPMQTESKPKQTRKSNKRRRLPNGFGQISEIKGHNLRNPFRAMVTTSKDEHGKPVCKPLKPKAYFATYNDAYAALMEYNKNPYELKPSMTIKELYDKWSERYYQTGISESTMRSFEAAWIYCEPLYKMKADELRIRHIKGCIENATRVIGKKTVTASCHTKNRMKSIFNLMLDYAVEYEIVDKNCARSFNLSNNIIKDRKTAENAHIPFTDEEMSLLWKNVNNIPYIDMLLFQCYSGWRPGELCLIEVKNVDMENGVIVGGMKTEAGKNRAVPIHPAVQPIIKQKYNEATQSKCKYLFNTHNDKSPMSYDQYRKHFDRIITELGLDPQHRPHDARVQFVTMAKRYDVDEYAIKYIVGHTISDITEKVYTQRKFDWLKTEIAKIK